MMQMFQQQCEQRLAQYNAQAQMVWQGIEKETGVDLVNVLWVPHPTENKIVPVQVKLSEKGFSN